MCFLGPTSAPIMHIQRRVGLRGLPSSSVVRVALGCAGRADVEPELYAPWVSARSGDTEVFVVHPEVSAFVREQNAALLLVQVPSLAASGVSEAAFLQTRRDLAPDLPVFEVEVHGSDVDVHTEPPAPTSEH